MTTPHRLTIAFALAGLCAVASCAPKQDKPDGTVTVRGGGGAAAAAASAFTYTPGEAGGTWEDTVTGTGTVAAVDPAARTVTLVAADGSRATFRASPDVRNFDQVRAGDRVNVTLGERIKVFVDRDRQGGAARAAAAGMLARAPKGAKPGGIVAESFEVTATVAALDPATRTATLRFADGDTMKIPVREDVELARYKVGDPVVIQVTQHLTVLVAAP